MTQPDVSWRQYEQAKAAAIQSGLAPFVALAAAGQAFVLADIEETQKAVEVLDAARRAADQKCSPLLRSWLAAAHGETLAANGERADSLRAFDSAASLLPPGALDPDGPYVALDPIHLARWRGYALARFADPDAVEVLATALEDLDPTFTRAETALRVDLATALAALGERTEARAQAEHAARLAAEIGSTRQQRRMRTLAVAIA
jgi:tetratricopeptide (TPR) repeat protein